MNIYARSFNEKNLSSFLVFVCLFVFVVIECNFMKFNQRIHFAKTKLGKSMNSFQENKIIGKNNTQNILSII